MADYTTYLQTVAAVCSAAAAAFAAHIARNAFKFQQSIALKKVVLDEIVSVINSLQYFLSLTEKTAIAVDDSEVVDLPKKINAVMHSLSNLQVTVNESVRSDVENLLEIVSSLDASNIFAPGEHSKASESATQLRDAIIAMGQIYRDEVK